MRDKSNNLILNIKTRTSFSSILSILYHSPTSVVSIHIQNIRLTCQIHLNKRRTFSYTILTHRPFSPVYILSSHKNHLIRSLSQSKYLYLYPHKTKNHAQTFAHTIFSPHFVGMFPSNPFSFASCPRNIRTPHSYVGQTAGKSHT